MTWIIHENDLPSQDSDFLSTIFTVGNGRHCTRGTLSEQRFDAFRGVYVSGLLTLAGYGLVYPMAAPDWLPAFLTMGDHTLRPSDSHRQLDLKSGVLTRTAAITSESARVTVREQRFASFDNPNLLAQRFTVEVAASTSPIDVVLGVDGEARNHPAKYYKPGQMPNCDNTGLKLSRIEHIEAHEAGVHVTIHSPQAAKRAAIAAHIRQIQGDAALCCTGTENGMATVAYRIPPADQPRTFVFEKIAILAADLPGHEEAIGHCSQLFDQTRNLSFEQALDHHTRAIEQFWQHADVEIDGDDNSQLALRFAIWSTRIAAPDDGGRSSIGAKNLTGDWYRCAVFWDMEMYQLPMLAAVEPQLAANHIRYRYNRLPAARRLANQDGYRGARFPFQSYMTGLEEPPVIGGFLYQQLHVNLAVAFGILHHFTLTRDAQLLIDAGLEILLELCRFWASRIHEGVDACHILDVCGPDEVHKGVNDNAYTNLFVAYLFRRTGALLDQLHEHYDSDINDLLSRLGIEPDERQHWLSLADRLHVPTLRDGTTFAQFEGFEQYPEPDESIIHQKGEGQDKRNKQADTLMLFQTIPHIFDRDTLERCFNEYASLCNQTSSLSLCSHALFAIRLGREGDAKRYFDWASGVDLADQYANTCHGIHGAGQGGIWLAVVAGFGGLQVRDHDIAIHPRLPRHWQRLRYRFFATQQPVEVDIQPDQFTVTNRGESPVKLTLLDTPAAISPNQSKTTPHQPDWRPRELHGVIFDLDGVLVSTDRFHYQAWKNLADELGLPFDETVNHKLRGVSREDSLRLIYGDHPLPDEQTFKDQCTRKNEQYKQLINQMTPNDVLPGSRELLAALRDAGIRIAVASASRNAQTVLDRTGLIDYIDALADGNIITVSKPDPQVFYLAAQRLRLLPWNCIGIEDAPAGIQSVRRAGMLAVAIGQQAGGADLNVSSVADLSLDTLRRLFAGKNPTANPYTERNLAKMKAELAEGWQRT